MIYSELDHQSRTIVNEIAFQSKVDHPQIYVFSYTCMTFLLLSP